MSETEKVINDLNVAKLMLCNPQVLTPEICVRIGQAINSAIDLLTEQEVAPEQKLIRCKDCAYRGEINCPQYYRRKELPDDWFCADGKPYCSRCGCEVEIGKDLCDKCMYEAQIEMEEHERMYEPTYNPEDGSM